MAYLGDFEDLGDLKVISALNLQAGLQSWPGARRSGRDDPTRSVRQADSDLRLKPETFLNPKP